MNHKDREILRSLAARVREIAELPEMETRKQRWYRHNDLEPERPLVLCFPEGAWEELLPRDDRSLKCSDPQARDWEYRLRKSIYWWELIRDDNVLEPYFDIPWRVDWGSYGVREVVTHGENRGSYTWDPPIKNLDEDFAKLRFRKPKVDRQTTLNELALATEIFGDLLPPRIHGQLWWSMGLTWEAIRLIGLEEFMIVMYDNPSGLHRLMAWLRDDHMRVIQWAEDEGLLSLNNTNGYTGSGGVAYTRQLPQPDWQPGMPVRLKDLWGFAESQETVGVSPEMFGEFILPYQLPLLARFGLNCYGCCEPLHARWDYVRTVPRLRRVSVSPWCDQRIMAEKMGRNYIFSRKPNPAMICVSFNEETVRADIRNTLQIAGSCPLEIIMKDTHTVQNDPTRITRWVQIALEEVHRFC